MHGHGQAEMDAEVVRLTARGCEGLTTKWIEDMVLLLIVLCYVTNHGEGSHKKDNSTGIAVAGWHLYPIPASHLL